ncbi:hypothetical protein L195_g040302, partial [Trifolium pratense]
GMRPDNLFPCSFRSSKDWLKFPRHEGTLPLKLFNDNSSSTSDLKLHMDGEIAPVNELFETSKICRLAFFHNQLGICAGIPRCCFRITERIRRGKLIDVKAFLKLQQGMAFMIMTLWLN